MEISILNQREEEHTRSRPELQHAPFPLFTSTLCPSCPTLLFLHTVCARQSV